MSDGDDEIVCENQKYYIFHFFFLKKKSYQILNIYEYIKY